MSEPSFSGPAELDRIVDLPDDAAAIVAARRVEHAIALHLKRRLQYDRNVYRIMFEGAGSLAGFEAKINIVFLCGLVDRATFKRLQIINLIASRFGEESRRTNFSSEPMKELVAKLAPEYDRFAAEHRARTEAIAAHSAKRRYVLACLQLAEVFSDAAAPESEPRL
jgi:hypothetical protein